MSYRAPYSANKLCLKCITNPPNYPFNSSLIKNRTKYLVSSKYHHILLIVFFPQSALYCLHNAKFQKEDNRLWAEGPLWKVRNLQIRQHILKYCVSGQDWTQNMFCWTTKLPAFWLMLVIFNGKRDEHLQVQREKALQNPCCRKK